MSNTSTPVKLDILGNEILPVATQSNFIAQAFSKEVIPFNPQIAAELMLEARTRIERKAKPYPGVWAWAKFNRPELVEKVNEYKLEFVKVTKLKDLPACYKWIFAFEQAAKKVIETYSKLMPATK